MQRNPRIAQFSIDLKTILSRYSHKNRPRNATITATTLTFRVRMRNEVYIRRARTETSGIMSNAMPLTWKYSPTTTTPQLWPLAALGFAMYNPYTCNNYVIGLATRAYKLTNETLFTTLVVLMCDRLHTGTSVSLFRSLTKKWYMKSGQTPPPTCVELAQRAIDIWPMTAANASNGSARRSIATTDTERSLLWFIYLSIKYLIICKWSQAADQY